jgi:M6 family metalloprotease-like protein
MDHYWREVSANQMNVAGTRVFGWFTLPQPKAAYMDGSSPRLSEMAAACTAAADGQVDFSQFFGIQTQFNDNFSLDANPGSAWGGSSYLSLDGPARVWPFTWMPLWATSNSLYGAFAHEMGHSLGLPHSSGPYGATYDSKWDVMSNSYIGAFGVYAIAGHTIVAHKNELGWIPSQRRRVVTNSVETFTLEQSAFPPAGSNPLMGEVAIPGTGAKYVIEARLLVGYDQNLPGEAVIIHKLGAGCYPLCATVVDDDGNGNPNDAGAMWRAGETFVGEGGVRVTINSRTENGWNITVNPNVVVAGQCTLNLVQSTGGTVSLSSGTLTGDCGRNVSVTAAASSDYVFRSWSNGAATSSLTVTLTQSTTLSALFVRQCSFALQQSTGGTSTVASGSALADCGRSITVLATAAPGFLFRSWSNGAESNPYTFNLDQNTTLSARFAQQCAVTLIQTTGGVIAMTQGSASGDCGRTITVSATPATGYVFIEWSDGGSASPRQVIASGVAQTVSGTFTDVNALASRVVASLLGNPGSGLSGGEVRYLDSNGNGNGSADLGDFLALLGRFPALQFNATVLNEKSMPRGDTGTSRKKK